MKSKKSILAGLAAVVMIALVVANWSRDSGSLTTTPAMAPETATKSPAPAPAPAVPAPTAAPAEGKPVPHFHAQLEDALPLPKILPASNFRIPVAARAYAAAARIPEVLAQQPCYCWCDKMGHGSLVDCFATDHGAG